MFRGPATKFRTATDKSCDFFLLNSEEARRVSRTRCQKLPNIQFKIINEDEKTRIQRFQPVLSIMKMVSDWKETDGLIEKRFSLHEILT